VEEPPPYLLMITVVTIQLVQVWGTLWREELTEQSRPRTKSKGPHQAGMKQ
jgi:hypothetical protein